MNKENVLSYNILRIGLAVTILWFGISQLMNPMYWTGYLPEFLISQSFISLNTLVYLNGVFEIILSFLLFMNKYVKITSIIMSIHLIFIIITLGFNEIGVRDFGILVGFVALVPISSNNEFSFRKIKKYNRNLRRNKIKF